MKRMAIVPLVFLASACAQQTPETWVPVDGVTSLQLQINVNSVERGQGIAVGRVTVESRAILRDETDWTYPIHQSKLIDCLAGASLYSGINDTVMIYSGVSQDIDDIESWALIDRVCSAAGFPRIEREGRVRRYVYVSRE
jgi:hypothetical protein